MSHENRRLGDHFFLSVLEAAVDESLKVMDRGPAHCRTCRYFSAYTSTKFYCFVTEVCVGQGHCMEPNLQLDDH